MNSAISKTLIAAAAVLIASGSAAQDGYPTKPVRMIVPFPPGGTTDIVARAVAQVVSKRLGQQVVIDNRGGANGVIGAEIAARSAPDGYSLFMTSASILTITPHMRDKLPYHPQRDFAPISLIAITPNVLVVHPSLPATSVKALVDLARARPGDVVFGSSGVGSIGHIVVAQMQLLTKAEFIHVPYKGAAPAEADLLGGHTGAMATGLVSAMPHVRAKRLRALAVTTKKRVSALPDLPAIAETIPGVDTGSWFGVLAPAGTPAPIVDRLSRELIAAVQDPGLRERLVAGGAEVVGNTPREFAEFIAGESARYAKVVNESGMRKPM